jgi:AraC family transcriptional regulator
MCREVAELCLTQEDGGPPTVLAAGSAPGEHGLSVFKVRFEGGLHLGETSPQQHLVWFQLSNVFIECRRAKRNFHDTVSTGSLAICRAGVDCAADAGQSLEAIMVAIEPGHFSLAAAEDSALGAQLIERLSGLDEPLFQLACALASECSRDYPNGPLYWNNIANNFLAGLVVRHTLEIDSRPRGRLSKYVLQRIRDYVLTHLDEPIDVAALAGLAARSPFHFTRVFAGSVGITPHRYVVHLRLQRAIELVRGGQSSLAEVAAATGFADQSHLSRWVRRVHGVSLTQFAA